MLDHQIYKRLADSIKCLTVDAIEKAGSGHPGLPLGMADVVAVLFKDFIKFNVDEPTWLNRDRFVLSAGHGSMLLYSLIFLLGYKDIELDDIKNFRQLGSKAAGHPEHGFLKAIETTTGPLGQGLANAVGMALASKVLAKEFGEEIINHKIYSLVGDGCLMEGISHEAASLAGHWCLNNLILMFDDNKISIDGPTDLTCSDDHIARFKSYGWDCLKVNGHDYQAIHQALEEAQNSKKPYFIAFETIIGHGSSNAGSHKMHGSPLGLEEILLIKKNLEFSNEPFEIDNRTLNLWKEISLSKKECYLHWEQIYLNLAENKRKELERRRSGRLPENFSEAIVECMNDIKSSNLNKEATRKSSGRVLKYLVKYLPELIGGSADLTDSNNTKVNYEHSKYVHYGVREHAMAAIMNGLAVYKGLIPYGGTFLAFSDYMRPAIRLSALMEQKIIYIMTHDSIGLGEDGPTHQPVEHLASFRAMPGLLTFRPADAIETLECWEIALQSNKPSILALTRQEVKIVRSDRLENKTSRGAYILEEDLNFQILIIATGSEVEIALEVKKILNDKSLAVRVVSMPCTNIFDQETIEYRKEILGEDNKLRVAIEAACGFGWEKYISLQGLFFGVNKLGTCGKAKDLYEYFNLTSSKIAQQILNKFKEIKNAKDCD